MTLDPRRVLILRQVLAAGSISAGARTLGWTQPAVTQHIAALEKSVGMPLVLRRSSGVVPTEAGRALLAHADVIASHLAAAETELKELRHCEAGTVRLAAFPSALATFVPSALKAVQDGSALRIRLVEAEPDQALRLLEDDQVDVAVAFHYDGAVQARQPDDGFRRTHIMSDPVSLVLPLASSAATATRLTLADLADEEWVAGCERCRANLIAMAHRAGFEPRISHETDDYVVVQSLVGRGLAVSVLPRIALEAYRSPAVVVRQTPEMTSRQIEAVYRPGADKIPSVARVLGALTTRTVGHLARQPRRPEADARRGPSACGLVG